MRRVLFLVAVLCLAAGPALAQDPMKADAKHWKVEFENDQVRVLRFKAAPHEKSPMHEHPNSVVISLSGGTTTFTAADGKTSKVTSQPGQVTWRAAEKHASENGDKPTEAIMIELKPAAAKPASTKPKQ